MSTYPDCDPACEICMDAGEFLGHADDCHDDHCALNGDHHSCNGQLEFCSCPAGAAARERAGLPPDDLKDPLPTGPEIGGWFTDY